ncbi:MAG: polyprenyl diphosphate synthase [Bacillota bacterium]
MRSSEEEYWLSRAREGNIPVHVGIIMDGNGRWAQRQGLKRHEGHRAGVESIRRCLPALVDLGIPYCTLFVFSTENWKRPYDEIQFLFNLVVDYTQKYKDELIANGIQVIPIGRWRKMPLPVLQALSEVARDTKAGSRLRLHMAINYGGRQEILDASLELARKLASRGPNNIPDDISEEVFSALLYTRGVPDPDLIIRTSGEQRLSNFLLWQGAYSELVFTDVLWPDFGPVDLYKSIVEYSQRNRRFGDVAGQKGDWPC